MRPPAGTAPLTYSAMGLPAGVDMNATTRTVSGTPTATGSGTATVTATDANDATGTVTLDWTVEADSEPAFSVETLAERTWTANTAIEAFTVDAATGGNVPLAYTATGLPAGVTMSADREVAGTPVATGSGTATVTVTDNDGDTDTVSFAWTVEPACVYPPSPLGPYTWIHGVAIDAVAVPESTCGTAPRTYSATGLPAGVAIAAGRVISGTPTATGSGTATVTVTDSNSGTHTLTFAWTVEADTEPMFAIDALPARSWSAGAAVAAFTVDAATGGNAPLAYTASGLPAGIAMNETTREVAGTPTAAGSGTATVTVTDRDGDTDSLTFAWAVAGDGSGTSTNPYILSNPLQVAALNIHSRLRGTGGGSSASSATYFRFTVPAGRAGQWTVAMDGSPNSGTDWDLRGDGELRSISGNADESDEVTLTAGQVYNFRVYPYRAQHRLTLTALTLTLTPPPSAVPVFPEDPPLGPFTWVNGAAITALTVPEATGGAGALTYTIAGQPAGLTLSGARVLSGTPTANGTGTATVTATDDNDATGTLTFDWTVEADTEPVFSITLPAQTWTRDRAIAAFTVAEATAGNAPLAYTASGLPAGVTMSADRMVAGTPTANGTGTATVTVTDHDGDTATTTFDWTVEADTEPVFASTALQNREWTEGTAITAFTIAAATGGNGMLTYTASGLPAGITLSASRSVSGTATRSGSGTAVVTARDRDGDSDTVRFAWTVSPGTGDLAPSFGSATVAEQSWNVGRAIASLTVPAATNGDGTLAYTIENLPAGLSMSTSRVVSGTPTATGSGTATVTVTDADRDFDQLSFEWTVFASTPVLSANPNPSTTGNFTVSWTAFRTNHVDYFLVETAPGGGTTSHAVEINGSKKFIAKPDGTYSYQMQGCGPQYDQATQTQVYRCTGLGNALSVTVDGPVPDSVSTQLNYTFTAHAGDFDSNGNNDLLIKRTSSGVGAGIFQNVILSQKTAGQFTLVAPSDTQVMTGSTYPVASSVNIVLGDFNLDGFVDVLLRGLGSAVTGALDQIVYAPGGKVGGYPVVLNAVDTEFTEFLTQTSSWIRDSAYFDDNADTIPIVTSAGVTTLYHCQEAETGDDYYADYPCPLDDTPIGVIHEPFVNVVNIISYHAFNDDALNFARQFSLVDGRVNPDVTLGSQQARNLSTILERVFGTEFLNGQLESACTGFFDYDSDSRIPCNNESLLGMLLMQTLFRSAREILPTEQVFQSRSLDPVERQLLIDNGLIFGQELLTAIEIVNFGELIVRGERIVGCGVIPLKDFSHIILCDSLFYQERFSNINELGLILHELTHVWQSQFTIPEGSPSSWQVNGSGGLIESERYTYRDPVSGNLPHNDFYQYTSEQQGAIMQDRYLACYKDIDGDGTLDREVEHNEKNRDNVRTVDDIFNQLNGLLNIPEIPLGVCVPPSDQQE